VHLDECLDAIVQAIRDRVNGGRTHGQVAVELNLRRREVSRIVRGERQIGFKTFLAIMEADPPWLQEQLARARASIGGSNGKGRKKRPN
jgi:hypothetical protein